MEVALAVLLVPTFAANQLEASDFNMLWAVISGGMCTFLNISRSKHQSTARHGPPNRLSYMERQ